MNFWEEHYEKFNEKLKLKDLILEDIEGDGNCLFRAIADQLENDEENHRIYRIRAVNYLKKNKKFFEKFIIDDTSFEKYCNNMENCGEWGGNLEIQALHKDLKINIILHVLEGPPIIIKDENFKNTVNLAFHTSDNIFEHYSSVKKLQEGIFFSKIYNLFKFFKLNHTQMKNKDKLQ